MARTKSNNVISLKLAPLAERQQHLSDQARKLRTIARAERETRVLLFFAGMLTGVMLCTASFELAIRGAGF